MPRVTQDTGTPERPTGMTANPDRNPTALDRFRQGVDVAHGVVTALEADRVRRPGPAHERQIFVGYLAARLEWGRGQRLELLPQPADTGAKDHAPTREYVDSR